MQRAKYVILKTIVIWGELSGAIFLGGNCPGGKWKWRKQRNYNLLVLKLFGKLPSSLGFSKSLFWTQDSRYHWSMFLVLESLQSEIWRNWSPILNEKSPRQENNPETFWQFKKSAKTWNVQRSLLQISIRVTRKGRNKIYTFRAEFIDADIPLGVLRR
jgi:hypothetical protein